MSPTSSSKRVPLSASSNQQGRSASAPVKAPRRCPKNALSNRLSLTLAQWTATSRPVRPEWQWMALATSSFPVPVSPVMRTGAELGAYWSSWKKTRLIS